MFGRRIRAAERVAEQLIRLGYLKFVPEPQLGVARQELIESLANGVVSTDWDDSGVSRDRRLYPADAESLAEGQIGRLITSMKSVLTREGVDASIIEDDYQETRYDVIVDGTRFFAWQPALRSGAAWAEAVRRTLEIVNELLEGVQSQERLYGVFWDNDCRVILLTRDMHSCIKASGLISDPREKPYSPSAIGVEGEINDDF